MLEKVLHTEEELAPLVLHLVLGGVMFPHGAQKLLGWRGGAGVGGTLEFFTASLGIPPPLALLVVLVEFSASLALLVGLLGRLAALGIATVMAGAVWLVHRPHGFFMNWFGGRQGEGFEYHLLAAGMALVLMLIGSGAFSVDRFLLQSRVWRSFSWPWGFLLLLFLLLAGSGPGAGTLPLESPRPLTKTALK